MRHTPPQGADTQFNGAWDEVLASAGGDLLQSWRWGTFKRSHGWRVARIRVDGMHGLAMAQVLFRRYGPVSVAYLPRGPVVVGGELAARRLLKKIDAACAAHRAIILVVEPGVELPEAWLSAPPGDGSPPKVTSFQPGPEPFQTARTVKVRLVEDAELLRRMRRDTRANVVRAQRRGVIVERAAVDAASIDEFYALLQETSRRNGFGIHARRYYADFLRVFDTDATLLFARSDGVATAALIVVRFGDEARSMYAGSSTGNRGRGDTALLRFEAMRWARDLGCTVYDLGGIAAETPLTGPQKKTAAVQRAGLDGVHQFKTGFGGEIVTFPPTVERRYRPALAWLVRRISHRYRASEPDVKPGIPFMPDLTFPLI